MKKSKLTWMLAPIIALMTTACSNDENIPGSDGNSNGVITFTVTPDYGVKTRAIDVTIPADKVLRCIMEVYEEGKNTADQREVIIVKRTYPFPAVNFRVEKKPGKKYTAAFWADFTDETSEDTQKQDLYYDTSNGLDEIAINSSNTTDFDGEAFYKNVAIDATGEAAETDITLKHAVAMMNLKTIAPLDGLKSVTVTYGDPSNANAPASSFNAVTGKTGNTKAAITKTNNISLPGTPSEDVPLGFHTFYVFAPEDAQSLINMSVTMCVEENGGTTSKPIEIPNVPIRANYKTNVTSNFSLLPTNFTISTESGWTSDLDPYAWNVAPDPTTKFNDNNSDGSKGNPYIIATANQLAQLAANVNVGNTYENKYFKMTADIDLGNRQWTQIGTSYEYQFLGHFDGNSCSVKRLVINNVDYDYTGLFGLCGPNSSIKNIHVSGKVTSNAVASGYYPPSAGGIVGSIGYDASVENCSFDGTVNCPNGNAGGIAGKIITSRVAYCKNTGAITGKNVGGIVGEPEQGAYYIEYCYNTGKIDGTDYAGGIAASMSQGTIGYCYNIGDVIGSGTYVSALTAYSDSKKGVSYCKQSYTNVLDIEKVFSQENWPKTDDEGWKADTGADGTDLNGHWKSLGGWNGGSPTYPKLWWEK